MTAGWVPNKLTLNEFVLVVSPPEPLQENFEKESPSVQQKTKKVGRTARQR